MKLPGNVIHTLKSFLNDGKVYCFDEKREIYPLSVLFSLSLFSSFVYFLRLIISNIRTMISIPELPAASV